MLNLIIIQIIIVSIFPGYGPGNEVCSLKTGTLLRVQMGNVYASHQAGCQVVIKPILSIPIKEPVYNDLYRSFREFVVRDYPI